MRYRLLGLAILSSVMLAPRGASANVSCRYGVYDSAPSSELRQVQRPGYRFSIPENYSAQLMNNGSVAVMDPDTVQFLDCMRRSRAGTGDYNYVTVRRVDARVLEGYWPYNIPSFEWMPLLSLITHSVGDDGQMTAEFGWESAMYGIMWSGFTNLTTGGFVHVSSGTADAQEVDVFETVWRFVESR